MNKAFLFIIFFAVFLKAGEINRWTDEGFVSSAEKKECLLSRWYDKDYYEEGLSTNYVPKREKRNSFVSYLKKIFYCCVLKKENIDVSYASNGTDGPEYADFNN